MWFQVALSLHWNFNAFSCLFIFYFLFLRICLCSWHFALCTLHFASHWPLFAFEKGSCVHARCAPVIKSIAFVHLLFSFFFFSSKLLSVFSFSLSFHVQRSTLTNLISTNSINQNLPLPKISNKYQSLI